MKRIFVINGYSRVGKSTFLREIKEANPKLKFEEYSMSDWGKNILLRVLCGDDEKMKLPPYEQDYRNALIALTNLGKMCGSIWSNLSARVGYSNADCIFIHSREPKDIEAIKRIFPETRAVLLRREGVKPANLQDEGVVEYQYDLYLDIPSLEDDEKYTQAVLDSWNKMINLP